MGNAEHIVGSEKLVAVLGYWPTFHDAEVVSVSAVRGLPVTLGEATVTLVVHVRKYETRGEGTTHFEQVLVASVLATFVCSHVADLELLEFNHQNVIDCLVVKDEPTAHAEASPLVLTFESIWGLGGMVRCARVELTTVKELPNAVA